jgi:hypothetical protein
MNGNVIPLSLQTIAKWQISPESNGDNIHAEIPAFQRGLVWNPAQIEVLWDSLLRGIPIGAISLIPMEGAERYSQTAADGGRKGYFILDGQQRCNAITLGFREFDGADKNPILWIDLLPSKEIQDRSNRRFFFYVTTPARPWGYSISDSNGENKSGNISPGRYREALERIKFESRDGQIKPVVEDLWPVEATLPVPFAVFRKFVDDGGEARFFDYISQNEDKLKLHEVGWYQNFREKRNVLSTENVELLEKKVSTITIAYRNALKTPIMALVAPSSLASWPAEQSQNFNADNDNSEIAVYFARLNKGGTPPSLEDLNYSILKSINPSLGKIENYKSYASGMPMHPSRMAHIAMLAYKSKMSKDMKIARNVTRRDAYSLGRDNAFVNFVCGANGEMSLLEKSLMQIDRWLLKSNDFEEGLLPMMRTAIARRNVNLFLFLVLLAEHVNSATLKLKQNQIVALVTMLAWFGDDNRLDYNDLYCTLRGSGDLDVEMTVKEWLFWQIEYGALHIPPPMSVMDNLIKSVSVAKGSSGNMDKVHQAWNPVSYENALNQLWYWNGETGRSIVLYACREYMEKTFGNYDPASVVWNEDARPWDYDHIIPSKWLISGQGRRQGDWHELVCEFLNSIGNIAPIPFSLNRSKQDAPPEEYLGDDNGLICLESEYTSLPFFRARPPKYLETEEKSAFAFAAAAAIRMKRVYDKWYSLPCAEWLDFSSVCNGRTEMIQEVTGVLKNYGRECRTVYEASNGQQLDVKEKWDVARWHLACGTIVRWPQKKQDENGLTIEECFACILEQGGRFHVGIRRHPDAKQMFGHTDKMWVDDRHHEYDSYQSAVDKFKQMLTELGI